MGSSGSRETFLTLLLMLVLLVRVLGVLPHH
jgi:hypothetical protein